MVNDGGNVDGSSDATMSCSPPSMMVMRTAEGSSLRVGWTGLGHGIEMPPDSAYAVELFDCDSDCRTCRFSGPRAVPGVEYSQFRCSNDTNVICDNDDDCDGATCRFYMGAGLETNIGGTGACARVGFTQLDAPVPNGSRQDASPVQGSVDLVTGDLRVDQITLHVDQGLCNYCENDGTTGDNVLGGTCSLGGADCDAQSPATLGNFLSFNCPWTVSLGEFDLDIAPLRTNAVEWTLGDDSPDCGAEGGKKCFCGVCNDGRMCHVDSDCDSGGCNSVASSRPDGCDDDPSALSITPASCTATDTDHNVGSCRFSVTPLVQFPSLPCFADNGAIGSSVRVFGAPGTFANDNASLTLASLACLPSADDGNALDNTLGIPGLAAVEIKFRAELIRE